MPEEFHDEPEPDNEREGIEERVEHFEAVDHGHSLRIFLQLRNSTKSQNRRMGCAGAVGGRISVCDPGCVGRHSRRAGHRLNGHHPRRAAGVAGVPGARQKLVREPAGALGQTSRGAGCV